MKPQKVFVPMEGMDGTIIENLGDGSFEIEFEDGEFGSYSADEIELL